MAENYVPVRIRHSSNRLWDGRIHWIKSSIESQPTDGRRTRSGCRSRTRRTRAFQHAAVARLLAAESTQWSATAVLTVCRAATAAAAAGWPFLIAKFLLPTPLCTSVWKPYLKEIKNNYKDIFCIWRTN